MHQVNQFAYQHPLLQQLKNWNATDVFSLFLLCLDDLLCIIMLVWFWNFVIISFTDSLLTGSSNINLLLIPKFFTIVSKYGLNFSATSLSSETTFSPYIRVILSLPPTLPEKKGFMVFQNCLLSVICLTLRLLK